MWLLVKGRGWGDRYFHDGRKILLGATRNWRASVVQAWELDCVNQTRQCAKIFYIASHTILSSKLFVVYLVFSLCFERQNGVTEGKDGV